jgi:hypothetical protein
MINSLRDMTSASAANELKRKKIVDGERGRDIAGNRDVCSYITEDETGTMVLQEVMVD